MTGRAILTAVCETPGWAPSQPISSSDERAIAELYQDGWIAPRLDGWEATPRALAEYPDFRGYDGLMGDVQPRQAPEPVVSDWVDVRRGRLLLTDDQVTRIGVAFHGESGAGRGTLELTWDSNTALEMVTEVEVVIRTRIIDFPASDQPEVEEEASEQTH